MCYTVNERKRMNSLKIFKGDIAICDMLFIMKNKHKIKLFIDADDTILKSSETTIDILNKKFNIIPPKTFDDIHDWGYRSIYGQCTDEIINDIYDSDEFFEQVEMYEDFLNFYNSHENDFEWYIVTKGHEKNIKNKEKYFKKYLPKAKVIGCKFKSYNDKEYDKSHIDMSYGIQIDDRTDCLMGTNSDTKILFKNKTEGYWNQINSANEDMYIANEWKEIIDILEFAANNPNLFVKGDMI